MTARLITAPSTEPLDLTTVKAQIRVDGTDEDTLITNLIKASREYVEKMTERALITQTWKLFMDEFPRSGTIYVPMPSLISVTSVTYYDTNNTLQTLSTSDYYVDTESEPGRIVTASVFPSTQSRPNAVSVQFSAGFGAASDVPQAIKQAMLLLIAHWYEHREAVVIGSGNVPTEIAFAVDALLSPYRVWRYA